MLLGTVFRSTFQQHKKSSLVLSYSQSATRKTQLGLLPSRRAKCTGLYMAVFCVYISYQELLVGKNFTML